MPFGTPGTFVAIIALVLAIGLLVWMRRRRRTVALPKSLTADSARDREVLDPDDEIPAPPVRRPSPSMERLLDTDVQVDLAEGTLAPDPWN